MPTGFCMGILWTEGPTCDENVHGQKAPRAELTGEQREGGPAVEGVRALALARVGVVLLPEVSGKAPLVHHVAHLVQHARGRWRSLRRRAASRRKKRFGRGCAVRRAGRGR